MVELVEVSRAPWNHKKELVPKAKLDTGFFMKPLNSFSWALALAAPLSEPKSKTLPLGPHQRKRSTGLAVRGWLLKTLYKNPTDGTKQFQARFGGCTKHRRCAALFQFLPFFQFSAIRRKRHLETDFARFDKGRLGRFGRLP